MPIYHQGQKCYDLRTEGEEIQMLCNEGQVVYCRPGDPLEWERCPILTKYRIVEENGANGLEKWWEFGMVLPAAYADFMTGNSAIGWSLCGGLIELHYEWTEDLATWFLGRLLPSPNGNESDGNPDPDAEMITHWSRSIYPQSSATKTAQFVADISFFEPDVRRATITNIVLDGVLQDLPNFPYVMPTEAALLQTDLRALGWTGATVTAASATDYQVSIPDVPITDYLLSSWVGWENFFTGRYDPFGNPAYSSLCNFTGTLVNGDNVRTDLPKQFCRVRLTLNAATIEAAMTAWLQYLKSQL